ncbi:hypothetical protein B0H13DRAFT_2000737 [Mycena leptocephala]|nr:hypothetical protein B0H13DRAFT_2000737 [Mycena leptocephala]
MDCPPVLPTELEREIFETTALMHSATIPPLLRVARRVLTWIEPLLYRTIFISERHPEMVRAVLSAMRSKPPDFFRTAVRHLALTSTRGTTVYERRQLLRLSAGVINFGCARRFVDSSDLPLLAEMQLQQLSVSLHELFGGSVDLSHSIFGTITHLQIFDALNESAMEIYAQLPALPALTHLRANFRLPWDILMTLLVKCPRLKLLLLLYPPYERRLYESLRIPQVYDLRFVIGMNDNYWDDWVAGAKGLPDNWSRGDDFVARKRRGNIDATCYWLD